MTDQVATEDGGVTGWVSAELQHNLIQPIADFQSPDQEWRRLFSELLGTFLLVIVAAGGGMMGTAFPNTISRTAAVVAPGLMVMGIIMFMGKISGAHLHPAISIAFALRRDFPWRRVPGYIIVQLIGATLAALVLHAVINVSAVNGSNYVASGFSTGTGFWMEVLLTFGLVSVILGTASGAQRCLGGGRLHRLGWAVGKPDLGGVDESGANVRPGSHRREVHRLLGLCRRTDLGWRRSGRRRLRAPRARWRAERLRCRPGSPVHRGRKAQQA